MSLLMVLLIGCGSTQKIDKSKLSKIKKVAVVVYTVPTKIEFKEDPRGKKGSFSISDVAKMVLKDATAGDGVRASELALKEFIHTINKQKLPFKFVSYNKMKRNKKFAAMGKKRAVASTKKEEKKSAMGGFMSSMSSLTGTAAPIGTGPKHLQNFGLVKNWWDGEAYMGTSDEAEYIKKSIAYLGVDAVLLINDPGFSFSCDACVGGTGSASTGSAFTVSLIGKNGEQILNLRQWFGVSKGSAAIITGMVNPLQQDKLFKQHGIKTARVFASELKEALAAK